MGYIKWVEGLPKGLKVLFAIIPVTDLIFDAYRIVREAMAKNWTLMVWDIVFTVYPIAIVSWVMDIITTISKGEPFNYANWFGEKGEGKAEEKPAEKPAEEKPADKPEAK
jgi:hypothetical protein